MTADGRVQRLDQGGDTVGEGQAYGMLIAVAIGDEERFDSIWGWTKDNIRRPDGLLSFLWKDGKVADPEAATDADVDAARALLVASCRFKRPGYKQEALDLGKAILDNETAYVPGLAGARRPARGLARTRSRSTRATSRPPRSRRWATRPATAAGAASRRARARSPTC